MRDFLEVDRTDLSVKNIELGYILPFSAILASGIIHFFTSL